MRRNFRHHNGDASVNNNYVCSFASRRAINATKADRCVEVKEIRYDFILPLLI